MSPQRLVAGVDSSTQSCKVLVCDADTGEVVREGRAPHPDGTAVDPQVWWTAFEQASSGGLLDGVEAIGVGAQQHGMVALDDGDEVIRDALLWNDTRSAGAAQDLVEELGAQTWAREVGVVPVASFTVTKVRWLARHEPEAAERVAGVVLPHDWLTGRILGEARERGAWTTDRGDASGTGYWSAHTGEYLPAMKRAALGRDFATPRVLAPAEAAGRTPGGMLVSAGTGDNMAAALGLGLLPGDVVVSMGTSGTVFAVAESASADPSGIVAGFADATGVWLPLVATLNAARVLGSTARLLGVDLDRFDALARAAEPGAGGLTLLPFLDGERTPDLPDATGSLTGMTRANLTRENLARSAVEGIVGTLAIGLRAMVEQGVQPRRVLLIGGAAASRAVQEVVADVLGLPVAVPAAGEYVGLGAARQAAWALGGEDLPPTWGIDVTTELEPPSRSGPSPAFARFEEALARLHP